MRKLFIISTVIAVLFSVQTALGQTSVKQTDCKQTDTEQISDNSGPKATVTYKTPRNVNPMIIKVNDLTNNDDKLTEKVIAEIYKLKKNKIKDVVTDKKYLKMTDDEKSVCISEGEVLKIINRIKK